MKFECLNGDIVFYLVCEENREIISESYPHVFDGSQIHSDIKYCHWDEYMVELYPNGGGEWGRLLLKTGCNYDGLQIERLNRLFYENITLPNLRDQKINEILK